MLAFTWSTSRVPNAIQMFCHPIFSGLLALSLSLWRPVSIQETIRYFTLPQLRYLNITLFRNLSDVELAESGTNRPVLTWRFPKLAFLHVNSIGKFSENDVLGLIRAHSRQLVELHASHLGGKLPTSDDWQRFCSLQLYVAGDIDMLVDAFSSVGTLWTRTSTNTSKEIIGTETIPRRLTMGLQYPHISRHTNMHVIQAFSQCQSILPNIDCTMAQTWESIRLPITLYQYVEGTYNALKRSLELMKTLGVDFVDPDGNGLDSYEARCLGEALDDEQVIRAFSSLT
ncbi:hypothetical protein PIIN_09699 [Serendipita indica DSM 11827]|uniref:Uncharacterized protein n=1 Tax=Serendipita indica (strain DSM 11827) TaxID=1109443 RepID=G4TWL6_SERID|nr:hypothetical protein PIIN_09699 [Serendipita indica DSM 11827]